MGKIEIITYIGIWFGIGFISCLLLLVYGLNFQNFFIENENRTERVDTLCSVSRIEYMGIELVNENMTLGQIRNLYCTDTYLTHKKILVDTTLDYVCDGRGDMFMEMVR